MRAENQKPHPVRKNATRMGHPTLPSGLVAIAVLFDPIATETTIFVSQFAAFLAHTCIVAVAKIAAQFMAIVGNLGAVVADVTVQTMVAIPGKSRRHAHSD